MSIDFSRHVSDARDETELCALFSDLLFDRFPQDKKQDQFLITPSASKRLQDCHLINRMFRAWYQTNWLNEDWSDHFEGATPRQELAAFRPTIGGGQAMLSVALEERIVSPLTGGTGQPRLEAVPRLFDQAMIRQPAGAFLYGLAELERHPTGVVAPNFDLGFRSLAERLRIIKTKAEEFPTYRPGDQSKGLVYWRLFVEQAIAGLLSSLNLDLDKEKELPRLHQDLSDILLSHAAVQKAGRCQYISIDHLFEHFWLAMSEADKNLRTHEEMLELNREPEEGAEDEAASWRKTEERISDPEYKYSQITYYLLGYLIDEQFLMPADRYFNAVEIVWQDKKSFLHNLVVFIDLLNRGLERADPKSDIDPEQLEEFKDYRMSQTAYDINNVWFNPSTCFRFHDWALEIV